MWIKSYIKYKSEQSIPFDLYFKNGKIQEVKSENFDGITPFQNNSKLAEDLKIEKVYNLSTSPNRAKYFIKKSIDGEVLLMFLDVNKSEYRRLKWQLKGYLIQSKEFKIGFVLAFLGAILAAILA